ncbi:hypothetical protein [Ferdinandcohnia sp. Marseille-Q9671]
MKNYKWIEQKLIDFEEIPEIKEFLQIQQFVLDNYEKPNIEDSLPDGFQLAGLYTPIAFPEEIYVGETINSPGGSDVLSWDHSQIINYYENYIYPKLTKINQSIFTNLFNEELKETFDLEFEEYNRLPADKKIEICYQLLIDLSLSGKIVYDN